MARLLLASLALLAILPGGAAVAAQYPPGFEERVLVAGLNQPTAIAWTPDGRMLVAEKRGVVRVVRPGTSTPALVADLSAQVNSHRDRGLMGIAVDSDFEANGFVYLLYTYELDPVAPDGSAPMVSRLGRFVLADDDTVGPETVLLGTDSTGPCQAPADDHDCVPADGASHGVGTVRSAPDGTLFVGSGDAAGFVTADPLSLNAYDERTPRGKILRVDRDGNGLPVHPFCPADADLTHVCTKVWGKGFRNPFRFTVRADNGLIVADVGWFSREEIDLIDPTEGGLSWGWPCYEGSIRTPQFRDMPECDDAAVGPQQPPDLDYGRTEGQTVLAGPEVGGRIYFADWAAGWIRHANAALGDVTGFATDWQGVDLEAGPTGNLTYVAFDGTVREIVPVPLPDPPAGDTTPGDAQGGSPPPAADPVPSATAAPATPTAQGPDRRCFVPDVRARTLASARRALARRRCRAGSVTRRRSRRVRPGRVLSQRPARPARLPRNGRVALVVSR